MTPVARVTQARKEAEADLDALRAVRDRLEALRTTTFAAAVHECMVMGGRSRKAQVHTDATVRVLRGASRRVDELLNWMSTLVVDLEEAERAARR